VNPTLDGPVVLLEGIIGKNWKLHACSGATLGAFPAAWIGAVASLILFGLACLQVTGRIAFLWGLVPLLLIVIELELVLALRA
jgi:hypothetical protein